jgi:hypothetical protein
MGRLRIAARLGDISFFPNYFDSTFLLIIVKYLKILSTDLLNIILIKKNINNEYILKIVYKSILLDPN